MLLMVDKITYFMISFKIKRIKTFELFDAQFVR